MRVGKQEDEHPQKAQKTQQAKDAAGNTYHQGIQGVNSTLIRTPMHQKKSTQNTCSQHSVSWNTGIHVPRCQLI